MKSRLAMLLALSLAAAAAGAQQLYRWTDEKGRVHITDTPPPPSAKNVQKKRPGTTSSMQAQTPYELSQATKAFPVTLYTAPNCNDPCSNARTVLNERGVPFKEIQVFDERTNAELRQLTSGRNEVPTLVVGRSVHVGFQHEAYDSLLDAARYPKKGSVPPRSQAKPAAPDAQPAQAEPEPPAATGPYAPKGTPAQK